MENQDNQPVVTDIAAPAPAKSQTGVWASVLLVVLIALTAGVYFYLRSLGTEDTTVTLITPSPSSESITPSPSAVASISPTDSSDKALESDSKSLDASLDAAASANKEIDTGLNDQQGDLSE